jgi:putative transposase
LRWWRSAVAYAEDEIKGAAPMSELAESTGVAEMIGPMTVDSIDQNELAEQLLAQAKEQNVELVGPDGLLGQLTKNVLETALDAEMSEHLGYEKHDPAGRGSGNSRNGTRAKTVLTEIGPVEIEVPRDTESTSSRRSSKSASAD